MASIYFSSMMDNMNLLHYFIQGLSRYVFMQICVIRHYSTAPPFTTCSIYAYLVFDAFSHSSPLPNTKPAFLDALLTVYVEARLPNEAVELCNLVRSDGNFISLSAFNVFLESLAVRGEIGGLGERFRADEWNEEMWD
ncbi:hypothetical protein C2S52_001403 [Perilla frutescens var. hirtella]|nr:hypothetical protein C2S52_001403 [Perilla frutescens var. hirtella]